MGKIDKVEFDEGVNDMNHTSRDMSKLLNNLRRGEEDYLSSNSFIGTIANGYKFGLLVVSVVGIGMGYFLSVTIHDPSVGMIFGVIGIVALLMLPTYFSYRCYVDKSSLKETYYILFFKISKEVHWKDIAYKRVKRDSEGNAYAIYLYNTNKKRLISFNYEIVGFGIILKMAKNVSKLKR